MTPATAHPPPRPSAPRRRRLPPLAHLPREARDTLFLLAVIGWIVLPQAPHLPPWCSALAAGVLLWRGALALSGRPLPGRWWLAGLLAVTLGATLATHGTLLGREAGVTLLVVLLALKTLELRARRDAFVVFFLGFFVMLTAFFQSQALLTAAAMLLGLLGLLTALIHAHRPVGQPSLWASARLAGGMALAGAPVMLALFMLFPRFAPLWGLPSDATLGRSGLSPHMRVGDIAELVLDEGIAFRVKFDGAPPPQAQQYFRGPVLTRFDGREWLPQGAPDFMPGAAGTPAVQTEGPAIGYEVTLEPSHRPWLITLDATLGAPQLPAGWRAMLTRDLQWLANRPVTDNLRYRAQSHPAFRYGLDRFHTARLGDALALPPGFNPRTLALAGQLRQELRQELRHEAPGAEPAALVQAALKRLRDGGYTYTLTPGLAGTHSADEFWFDTKAGFCEHIASAFVVLMRAAGVPARVVTGYQGGELNALDGYWTVRNADAHAWAEVWLDGRGWARVDPTGAVSPGRVGQFQRLRAPPGLVGSAIATLSPTALAQLRAVWEAVNNRWNQWVLNYTQSRQLDLLKQLGFDAPSWQDLGRVLAALLALAALLGSAWALWERQRHDPWQRLLARERRRLTRAGLAVPPAATPRALAAAVQASAWPPALRHAWQQHLLALEQWRYAAAPGRQSQRGQHGPRRLATLRRQSRRLAAPPLAHATAVPATPATPATPSA